MQTSQDGLNKLIIREGLRTHAYQDSKGVWTIGIGHTSMAGPPAVHKDLVLTEAEVKTLFAKDIIKYEKDVNEVFPDGLPQNAFDGAVSFHYNTGAIKTASWPSFYKKGQFVAAKQHFLQWNKPADIIPRRESEANQIFTETNNSVPIISVPLVPPTLPIPSTPLPKQSWFITFLKLLFLGHT